MTPVSRVWRQLCLLAALAVAALGASVSVRATQEAATGVRSTSAVVRDLLDDAMWESPTFRGLVKAIAATDGIVYVEEGVCRHSVHACLVLDVTPAAGYRILHVLVDVHRKRLDLLGTLGHELCHALEVLADPSIKTASGLFLFYARMAPTGTSTFETGTAVSTGLKVRNEVGRQPMLVLQQVALNMPR